VPIVQFKHFKQGLVSWADDDFADSQAARRRGRAVARPIGAGTLPIEGSRDDVRNALRGVGRFMAEAWSENQHSPRNWPEHR
jgi:hypothetical protein